MPNVFATRDQILSRVVSTLTREAAAAAGNGAVLSKDEHAALPKWPDVLRGAADEVRRAGGAGATVQMDPWLDAAAAKVTGALDAVDRKGRGQGRISLAEARTAVATKSDAGARIGKAFEALTGKKLDVTTPASPALQAAATEWLNAAGLGVFAALTDDEPTAWLQRKIDGAIEGWGADGTSFVARARIGDQTVRVASGTTFKDGAFVELIGVFDKEGRVLARASIARDDDTYAITMKAADGAVLAQVPAPGAAAPPQAWVDGLKAVLQAKYDEGEDLGVSVKRADVPPAVLRAYEFGERNVADGVGLERVDHDGKSAWAIHDYSCVSSAAIYSDDGVQLFSFVN